jgi:hypothetical protein
MKKILVYTLLVFLFLVACQNTKVKKQNLFATRPDTELFFKNVRQIFYDKEEQSQTKLHLYRFSKREKESKKPYFQTVIIHNWQQNEAYFLLEPQNFEDIHQWVLLVKNPKNKQSIQKEWKFGDKTQHLEMASFIYEQINQQSEFILSCKNQKNSILEGKERESFRVSFKDYNKLTGGE